MYQDGHHHVNTYSYIKHLVIQTRFLKYRNLQIVVTALTNLIFLDRINGGLIITNMPHPPLPIRYQRSWGQ